MNTETKDIAQGGIGEGAAVYTDALLITKVKSTLLSHRSVNAVSTEVFAENGTVTLSGQATSKAQRDLASEYTRDVEGVKKVKNEMTVATAAMKPGEKSLGEKLDAFTERFSAFTESIDDSFISGLVRTTLLYNRSTSAINTSVDVKDGMVRLGGKARNEAEKELATKLVSDVHGVKTVVNDMTVEGSGTV